MKYFLTTDRCGFSYWSKNDLPSALLLWGDPEVTKYICANGIFTLREIERRLKNEIENFEKYGVQYFPVFTLSDDELIGCCGLRPYKAEKSVYELGFHLRQKFWHNGYATECAAAMINYAFKNFNAIELKAGHNPNNIASKKVLLKLGFKYEKDEYYAPTGLFHPLYAISEIQV